MIEKKPKNEFRRPGPTKVIVSSFLAVILAGTLLLMLPIASRNEPLSLTDAFFTATSATCVTGLVVVDTYTHFTTFGQVVILLLIQVGGLGLVTLTSFFNIVVGRRLGFKSLRLASESISSSDTGRAFPLLRFVVSVAVVAETVGAVLLSFHFVPRFGAEGVFISAFLAISAFCNAGFDIMGRLGQYSSLTTFAGNGYVLCVIAVLIIAGGLGFLVWYDLMNYRKTKHLQMHTKIVMTATAFLLVAGTVCIAALEWNNPATLGAYHGVGQKLLNAAFQSVSTRTAGFNTFNLGACNSFTKMIMVLLMFVGAAPGGTGGGIKVTAITVIVVAVHSVIVGREEASLGGRHISHKVVYKAQAVIFLAVCVVVICAVMIHTNLIGRPADVIDSVFESTSAFATVGLSVGITARMNTVAKIITMVTMFVGRVGPVALMMSLSRHVNKAEKRLVEPEANIIVC